MPKYGQYDVPNADTMVNFGTGQPNNLNLPIEWFQSTCAKMATDMFGSNPNEHNQLLQYGAISGYDDIKYKLAEWLTHRYYGYLDTPKLNVDHLISPDQLFMTNGNTGAIHTLISKYTESTDYIIVENPTYFIAINMFKEYGLNVEGVNMESDGVNLVELENKIIELNTDEKYKQSVLFFYMIPTHHNPTGITTTHEKRLKIAELCDKYDNLYVIADEVYHFLTFNSTCNFYPMADYHPKMISLGSFSKILAPALRVGWIYQNIHHQKFKDEYGFVTGTSGLNNSSVLDSSGGINPIGFKFIEYALERKDGDIRQIDQIISKNINYLQTNCEIMMEYLEQFKHVEFIRPRGGYFLWLGLKTIKNTTEFLKICEKNKVKFHPGIKFTTDSSMGNCIRLSFSYYSSSDLIVGLERLMDCIVKYNSINIKIMGANGKLGSLIKKEIFNIKDFNYMGDIKRAYSKADFDGLIPYNTVLIDVSSNEGTHDLLVFLMAHKLYYPVIVGTTGISQNTINVMKVYSEFAPIAHITNFSEGIPLIRQFAKLSNNLTSEWKFLMTDIHHVHKKDAPSGTAKTIKSEIVRDIPIESIRTGEVIGEHVLELTNGSEVIKIIHSVSNRDTFAKGCINYIYWILTLPNGFFNKMESHMNVQTVDYINEVIGIAKLSKDIPSVVLNYITKSIQSTNPSLTKIGIVREGNDSKYFTHLFSVSNNLIKPISYCGYTLYNIVKYIWANYEDCEGKLCVESTQYKFKNSADNSMVKLPSLTYVDNKKNDNSINELINQITNLTLFGVGRYKFNDLRYLILEIKDNIFNSDMLGTISTVINAEQPSNAKYNVVFVNTNYWGQKDNETLFIRYFDSESNEEVSDCTIGCTAVFEYYLFHFIKNYKENKSISIKMINNKLVNLIYYSNDFYIWDNNN
jgi:DNA-binding transcriptional MocR family regulator/dihydrodipicolinate reductase